MNEIHAFTGRIRALIAKDDLKEALRQLRLLLENSPALEEALMQEERFRDIRRQIRLGLVDEEQANLLHNRISAGILELLRELESPEGIQSALRAEVERAAGVVNSKNVVVDSTLTAGRDLSIGDNHYHYYGERKIPRLLSTPPFIPPVFIGRDEELREVHDRLFGGQHLLLLVNGQGGIGKTSFAAKYWELYEDKYCHLAFVYVGGGIAEALLSTVAPALAMDFPDQMPTLQRFEQLIFFVANLQKPCLLVLDNANDAGDLEKIYPLLGRCTNFHLLLTSRLAEFEETASYAVGALKEAFPLDLFKKYYPRHQEAENELFWGIFRAVGGNTLVMEILAKNLREINQDETFYPLSQLLADLQGKGLLQLSEQAKVKVHWRGFEKTEPEQIIQALYELHPLEADELALLSNFAVLPPENIPYPILKSLLQPENARQFSDTLTRLFRKGWIEKGESDGVTYYKTSPVVQEIVRRKNPELHRDCRRLVDALNEKLKYEFGTGHFLNVTYAEALHFAWYAEAVFSNLPEPDWNLSVLTDRIGSFHETTGNLEQALYFYEAFMQVSKILCASEPDNADFKDGLAISYEKLGITQSALGNLEQALTLFEQYNLLEKELYEAFPQNVEFKEGIGWSNQFMGNTHLALGNLDQALTSYEQMSKVFEELYDAYPQNVKFKDGLAISYQNLGITQRALGNLEQALTLFEQYNLLEKELYDAFPQNVKFKDGLAISYEKLGSTQRALGNLEQALTFFEDETKLFEELYEAYPQNVSFKNGLASSYQKLGSTQRALGNLEQALAFFEKYIELTKELYDAFPQNVEFKNNLAISYGELGETQGALGNLEQALAFFEKYIELTKELYDAFPQNVEFKNNLAISYEKLGSTQSALGNLEQALIFFEDVVKLSEELYEAYPQNVSFKNGLAISYQNLGITQSELGNLEQALTFFEQFNHLEKELYEFFPQNVEFKKNLAVSYSKLGSTQRALGNLEQALTFFEKDIELTKELYEAYPQNVEFKNGLAVSYSKLGIFYRDQKEDNAQARPYFERCYTLWKELSEAYPAYVEFQKNFKWAEGALKDLE